MKTILNNPQRFKDIIKRFYSGTCTITEKKSVKDEKTFKTRIQEVMKYENIPCRLSHSSNNLSDAYPRNTVTQTIKLFLDNDYEIKAGSKIAVTQDGITNIYGATSEPNVFETHQEIELILWEDWSVKGSKRINQEIQDN